MKWVLIFSSKFYIFYYILTFFSICLFFSRLGYSKTSEILDHEFFHSVDLDAIYNQKYIPSYIPHDPGIVSPFMDQYAQENIAISSSSSNKPDYKYQHSMSSSSKISLDSCLNFKDFPHENQDFFKEF